MQPSDLSRQHTVDSRNSKDFTIQAINVPDTLKWPTVPENLPQVPFRMGLFACSGGGKTTLMVNLLMNKNFYKGYFDQVIIWSPTISVDPTWKALLKLPANLKKKIHPKEEWNDEELVKILQWQENRIAKLPPGKTLPILFIFDDMIGSKIMSSRLFRDLFFKGRHLHISLVLSFQAYKRVLRDLRDQLTDVVVLNVQKDELGKIAEEQANPLVGKKKYEAIYNKLKNENKHAFLYRKCTRGDMKAQYYSCFDHVIDVNDEKEEDNMLEK